VVASLERCVRKDCVARMLGSVEVQMTFAVDQDVRASLAIATGVLQGCLRLVPWYRLSVLWWGRGISAVVVPGIPVSQAYAVLRLGFAGVGMVTARSRNARASMVIAMGA
jgi:hypothetical protein